jgi:rare lipoprotein A
LTFQKQALWAASFIARILIMKSAAKISAQWTKYLPALLAVLALCTGCAAPSKFMMPPARQDQRLPQPLTGFRQTGVASYYMQDTINYITASGEPYDMNALTAAHATLPFNTLVRVTNLSNNQSVVVRVNDRGPYTKRRIIDLSLAAARQIGLIETGTERVEIEVVKGP